MHPDAVIAIAADDEVARADRGNLRRQHRLAAVAAAGLRARPDAGKIRAREPEGDRRRAGEPRAVHVGAGRADLLRDHHRHDQQGDRLARGQDRHQAGVRRQGDRAGGPGEAPRRCGAADAGDPRRDRQGREEGRPFRRRAGGAPNSSTRRGCGNSRRSAPPARITSCAPRSARSSSTTPATSRRRSRALAPRSPPIVPTTPPTTSAAAIPTARLCATRTRSSTSFPASA